MPICLLVLVLLATSSWAQEIALQNPGFEQVSANDPTMPAGWERWQAGPKQVRLDQDNPYQGAYCAALSPNPPGRGAVVLKQYFTEYQPGAEYEVVFAGRTNGVAAGRLQVINWTAVANQRPASEIYPGNAVTFDNTQWQLFATTFTAPKQAGQQLYLELSHEADAPPQAIIWWDEFSIRPLESKHRELLNLARDLGLEVYMLLVRARFEIGSSCDLIDYLLDDAEKHAGLNAARSRPLRQRVAELRDHMETALARLHSQHDAVYETKAPVTRLNPEELAQREALLQDTRQAIGRAVEELRTTCLATLATLRADARAAAGEFTIPPQVASEVTTATLADRFHRIVSWHGYMSEVEYVHRALWSLPATIVQGYLWREDKWSLRDSFLAINTPRTLPYLERVLAEDWPELTGLKANVARDLAMIGDRPGFRGFEIDEPQIEDGHLANEAGYAAFRAYLADKYPPERLRGLGLDQLEGWTVTQTVGDNPVAWMEWQYFKIHVMTQRLREAQEFIKSQPGQPVLLPVIQQFVPSVPQRASWVSVPAALDWVGMDPYNGGAPSEAFEMDLLRSNSRGPTYLVVGTCYDATAARFHKDMSISLGHADGLWVWCWVYMSKYRATSFSARGWERRFRHLWKPGMWEAAQEVFAKIASAEPYLVHTTSATPIAVVFSERTGIFDSGAKPGNDLIRHFQVVEGLYRALHHSHLAPEAVFAESLTPERLANRKLLLMVDTRLLTDQEIDLLRDWVRNGGTLVAMGPTSLYDQWGRQREDFALADVFGASYRGSIDTPGAIVPGEPLRRMRLDLPESIALPPARPAELVQPTTAAVMATWTDGQPAVLHSRFGHGAAWLITTSWLPAAYDGGSSLKAVVRSYHPGVRELLEAICRSAVPQLPVETIGCPPDVELSLRRQGQRIIVHLLNYADDTTVSDLSLLVPTERPLRIFDPTRPAEVLSTVHAEGRVTVAVPPFEHHTMLVIEPTVG